MFLLQLEQPVSRLRVKQLQSSKGIWLDMDEDGVHLDCRWFQYKCCSVRL